MLRKIHGYVADLLPALGKPKRFLLAYLNKYLKIKDSYSQIGDDKIAIELLKTRAINRPLFYIDVGANHPSKLSNTYRMYREGGKGITIDPNAELMRLHKLVRPMDIQLAVGCGCEIKLQKFYYSKTPVLSSFEKTQVGNMWGEDYLPVFTLDKICADINVSNVDFLSIDTEGLDIEVLKGATKTLTKTYLVCIEANTADHEATIIQYMNAQNFKLSVNNRFNLFFINNHHVL